MLQLDEVNRVTAAVLRPSTIALILRCFPEFFPADWNPTDDELERVCLAIARAAEDMYGDRW